MIDWLTLKIDAMDLDPRTAQSLRDRSGRVLKISPAGEIEWETSAREVVRSDSHQVTVSMGGELSISGSPARVLASNNVFGSCDPLECGKAMLDFVARTCAVTLPKYSAFRCTRMDVTENYDMGSLHQVREALMALRHAEGGRYQLRTDAETVYWSIRSMLRCGKAYAKGPHAHYQVKRGQAEFSKEQLEQVQRLLRLELSLKSQWWRERSGKPWWAFSADDLATIHQEYFSPLIGGAQVWEEGKMKEEVVKAALSLGYSEGRGEAAYLYWLMIQAVGFETACASIGKRTHFRHVKVLREAGLSWSDFQARRIVAFRRKPLVLAQPVRSWGDLPAMRVA